MLSEQQFPRSHLGPLGGRGGGARAGSERERPDVIQDEAVRAVFAVAPRVGQVHGRRVRDLQRAQTRVQINFHLNGVN